MKTIFNTTENNDTVAIKEGKTSDKNTFMYIETLDLRPIIKTPAAAAAIKAIKFVDTLVLPKNRDDDTMSAIAGIKMSFVDDILYLDDDEPIVKTKGIEYKNTHLVELFESDFSAQAIECKNCGIVAIHAISNTDITFPQVELTNVAAIFMDNSLKKCANSFEYKNSASIRYCNLPEDANIQRYMNEKVKVTTGTLKIWGKNAILICTDSTLDFDDNITAEEFTSYNFLFLFNSTKIKVGKKLYNVILNNSICNNVKCKRK